MRHGRAKAARKTLRYFDRTVNLKNKPYYSVLLDATFLIAMIRITSSSSSSEGASNTDGSSVVSRIERVLQVNNGGGGPSFVRDERLTGVVGGGGYYDHHNDDHGQDTNSQQYNNTTNNNSGHHFSRFTVRYFIPREAVDEIEAIIQTFQERSENTKKPKKQRQYQAKSKVFEDALAWIKTNSSKKQNYLGNARCEVLPRLEAAVEPPPSKKQKRKLRKQQEEETENDDNDEADNEPAAIGASDAVRRHIARDDGREDPETNQTKQQQQSPQQCSFTRTYIVASQEEDLLDGLRMLGTVPILRCANNASVLILENASKKGQRTDDGREQLKWKGALQNPAERALVDAAWEAQKKARVKITGVGGVTAAAYSAAENKRGLNNKAKGPNPLSCKRKRASKVGPQKQGGAAGSGESKSKKRRARAQRQKNKSAEETSGDASPKE